MAIFRFLKMAAAAIINLAAAAILDFRNFNFLTVGTIKWVKVHHDAKFRQNHSN